MSANERAVWQHGSVTAAHLVADRIARIVLHPERPVPAGPGSHVDVSLGNGARSEVRSYSVIEASEDGSELVLSVLLTEASRGGSKAMHALTAGDRIRFTQPISHFPLSYSAPHYALLAGGIGITAIAPMARELLRSNKDYRLTYVGQSASRMAYVEELRRLHGGRASVLDRASGGLDVNRFVADLEPGTELYMCGPIRLMSAVRSAWLAAGRPIGALRTETFGSSGWFDPQPFEVHVPRLGLSVTVERDATILEALERAGADVMFDCRRGECGLCEMRVHRLVGDIDHRDVFYSERQRNARAKLCACVSRVIADSTGTASITVEMS